MREKEDLMARLQSVDEMLVHEENRRAQQLMVGTPRQAMTVDGRLPADGRAACAGRTRRVFRRLAR